MMYIFPRQFRLHNIFTSQVDKTKTSQKFQDYTIREEEIATTLKPHKVKIKIPKRLRGRPCDLVERLQVRHSRCSYAELLRHYCPSPLQAARRARGNTSLSRKSVHHSQSIASTQTQQSGSSQGRPRSRKQVRKTPQLSATLEYDNITDLSCPMAKVSAFCQSVLSTLVPDGFWGEGDTMQHNKAIILSKVDRFIKMRRFETMSLHEITQGLKVELQVFVEMFHLD
jgi:telomerase reverse transcriptase